MTLLAILDGEQRAYDREKAVKEQTQGNLTPLLAGFPR